MWESRFFVFTGGDFTVYRIDFYRDENGVSELQEFIDFLWDASPRSKDAHIQYEQIALQIKLLCEKGTNLPSKYTKHIDENIWELRPGKNRILYFCWLDDTFVLLHYFQKKTEKTPVKEIERAKRERDEYIRRHKQ